MAKSQHSYIKRQKELKRLKKAEEKRKRRRKKSTGDPDEGAGEDRIPETPGN